MQCLHHVQVQSMQLKRGAHTCAAAHGLLFAIGGFDGSLGEGCGHKAFMASGVCVHARASARGCAWVHACVSVCTYRCACMHACMYVCVRMRVWPMYVVVAVVLRACICIWFVAAGRGYCCWEMVLLLGEVLLSGC